jgi:hypothetical protein
LSVLTYTYLYSFPSYPIIPSPIPTFWPRTNYRRDVSSGGWLLVSGLCLCFDPARSIGVDGWGVMCLIVGESCLSLTPHKLSEGCLEWCSFICVVFGVYVLSWWDVIDVLSWCSGWGV